ncbi:MAG: ABC transporter substrate-binding protein [Oscillospiraceae bacterium]
MKMKKFFALVMAMVMCLGLLAGCGQDYEATDAPPPRPPLPKLPRPASETASERGSFKFGGIGPLTGDNATYGVAVMNGAQIAVDEINAAGGINGYQVEFKLPGRRLRQRDRDERLQQADGQRHAGPGWPRHHRPGHLRLRPGLHRPRLCPDPQRLLPDVVTGKDNMFQLCFTDPNQGMGAAVYMGTNMADTKVAVIYRNDDAYSQGIRDTFVAEAANQGLEVVYEGTFTADTATDFSVQLTEPRPPEPTWCSCPSTSSPPPSSSPRPTPWAMSRPSSAWTAWTAS